jgi:hypothetical protein
MGTNSALSSSICPNWGRQPDTDGLVLAVRLVLALQGAACQLIAQ